MKTCFSAIALLLLSIFSAARAEITVYTASDISTYTTALRDDVQSGRISNAEYEATLKRIPDLQEASAASMRRQLQVLQDAMAALKADTPAAGPPAPLISGDAPALWPLDPPSGSAVLLKPYTTFFYRGQEFKLEELRGGHNGRVAGACQTNHPVFNPEKNRWGIRSTNNLIEFEVPIPAGPMRISSLPGPAGAPEGLLFSKDGSLPAFPSESTFEVQLKAELPDGETLLTRTPLRLRARDVTSWPPPPGTAYVSAGRVELFPEGAGADADPTLVILPDSTILTEVMMSAPKPAWAR